MVLNRILSAFLPLIYFTVQYKFRVHLLSLHPGLATPGLIFWLLWSFDAIFLTALSVQGANVNQMVCQMIVFDTICWPSLIKVIFYRTDAAIFMCVSCVFGVVVKRRWLANSGLSQSLWTTIPKKFCHPKTNSVQDA